MPRYKLTVAYDGTDFCGWQKQEPPARGEEEGSAVTPAYSDTTPMMPGEREGRVALRTVQGVLERAVREVCREPVELMGASRTDSGVHARGQVAAFSTMPGGRGTGWPSERGTDKLLMAVNSRLPDDVLVIHASEVPVGFDPIGGAVRKMYSYTFSVGPARPLWDRRTINWLPRGALNLEAMRTGAAHLVGEHDFAAFAAAGHGRLSTVRRVDALRLSERAGECGNQIVRMEIEGNGFLWNMVRIVAGTLMQVGIGQRTDQSVADALASRDRSKAGITAPPQGLCLERIWYGGEG